jgi:guanine nucleotide-binding protein G(i) subunit alpha
MKIIHQNGYTPDELALYRLTIYKNLVDCAKALIGAMAQFEIQFDDPQNKEYADYIWNYTVDPDPHRPIEADIGTAVLSIRKDGAYEKVMDHQSEFYLMDSAP